MINELRIYDQSTSQLRVYDNYYINTSSHFQQQKQKQKKTSVRVLAHSCQDTKLLESGNRKSFGKHVGYHVKIDTISFHKIDTISFHKITNKVKFNFYVLGSSPAYLTFAMHMADWLSSKITVLLMFLPSKSLLNFCSHIAS